VGVRDERHIRKGAAAMSDDIATLQARHVMQCWSAQRDYAPIVV